MTKQEEIREGLYELIADALARMSLDTGVGLNELIAEIQKFEVSKGVVIKTGNLTSVAVHIGKEVHQAEFTSITEAKNIAVVEELI